VQAAATPLLAHLSLLFVPVGVGVMTHLGLIGQYGLRMLAGAGAVHLDRPAGHRLVLRWLLPARRPANGGRGAMTDFVNLWVYLSATPLFGLTATLGVYVLASAMLSTAGWASRPGPIRCCGRW
jgi:hypothetical protein